MASQPESAVYDAGVFQLETTTPVTGGVGGASNTPLLNLANRTAYLKAHMDAIEASAASFAPINSPAFTGSPTVPDVAAADSSGKASNTKFVQNAVSGISAINVAGNSNVTLTAAQYGCGILVFSGALTGNIDVIVPAAADAWLASNQTSGAFTLRVKTAAGTGVFVTQGRDTLLWCDATNVRNSKNDFASIGLTGVSTAVSPAVGDNTQQVVPAAWVNNAMSGVTSVNVGGNTDVTLTQAQYGCGIVVLTGTLTGNINVIVPTQNDNWIFSNQTAGAFSVTVKTAAGLGVAVTQSQNFMVFCDGTNAALLNASLDSTNPLVRKPKILGPIAGSTIVGSTPSLQGDPYYSLYQVPQGAAQFQVSTSAGFGTTAFDSGTIGAVNSAQVAAGNLSASVTYYARCRYQDIEGAWSPWADGVQFTTGTQAVATPSITSPANAATNVGDGVTLTGNAFAMTSGSDTEFAADWEVWTGTGGTGTLVFSSYDDTANLTSIAVPAGTFTVNTVYYPRVRYSGVTSGYSAWSAAVHFTTAASFGTVLSAGAAYGGGYFGGYVMIGGTKYALIVSGSSGNIYNGDLTAGGSSSTILSVNDGKANFAAYIARNQYSGGNDAVRFVKGLNDTKYQGFNDWYLGARDEVEIIYRTLKPTTTANDTSSGANANAFPSATGNYTSGAPAQTAATNFKSGGNDTFNVNSRQVGCLTFASAGSNSTYQQDFDNGKQTTHGAGNNVNYRAIRRVPA